MNHTFNELFRSYTYLQKITITPPPRKRDVQRAITLITNLDKEGHDTDAFLFPQSLLVVLEQRRIPVNKLHLKLTQKGEDKYINKLHSYSRNKKQIKNQFKKREGIN